MHRLSRPLPTITLLALAMTAACGDSDSPTGTSTSGSGGSTSSTSIASGPGTTSSTSMMVCVPGTTTPCYSGPPGTEGVGACVAGVQTCQPDGNQGPCIGQVVPTPKDCSTPADEACTGDPGPCAAPPLFAGIYGVGALDDGLAVASDALGNTYFSGTSSQPGIDFGAGPLPAGMFVVKFDPTGAVIWQKSPGYGYAHSIATDSSGGVVLFGAFGPTLDFGGMPFTVSDDAIFLAKLDADGAPVFVKSFASQFVEDYYLWALAIAPNDDIVVGGAFYDSLDLGGGAMTSADGLDAFVASFAPDGTLAWDQQYGGAGDQAVIGVAVDTQGHIAVGGAYGGTVDFGSTQITAGDNYDAFVAKLDASGTTLWVKPIASTKGQYATGVATDAAGNVAVIGTTSDPIDFGSGPEIANAADSRCFAAQLTEASGAVMWSKAFGCHVNQYVPFSPRIMVDANGSTIIAGGFGGHTDFGSGTVYSGGESDGFALKLGAGGAFTWLRTYDSGKYDQCRDVALDPQGNIILAGEIEGPAADLGGGLIPAPGSGIEAFIVKSPP